MSATVFQGSEFPSAIRENYRYTSLERLLPPELTFQDIEAKARPLNNSPLPAALVDAFFSFQDPLLEGAVRASSAQPPRVLEARAGFPEQPEVLGCQQAVEAFHLNFSFPVSFHHLKIQNPESHNPALQFFYSAVKSGTQARLVLDVSSFPGRTLSVIVWLRLEEKAEAEVYLLMSGGGLARVNIYGILDGQNARLDLRGALLSEDGAHHDVQAVLSHRASLTTSHQKIRILGAGQSVSAFSGKIQVAPQASGTEAYQSARGLLLSGEAAIYARPFLEIYTDNVRCSHGCTTGHMNEEQIYYLRSRGVTDTVARRLLAEAFVLEAFQDATPAAVRDFLNSALQNQLLSCTS